MPIDDAAALSDAAHDAAERGRVVYLVGPDGTRLAAIVPPNVAVAGAAAVEALEDADDLAAAASALAQWERDDRRTYTLTEIDTELGEG